MNESTNASTQGRVEILRENPLNYRSLRALDDITVRLREAEGALKRIADLPNGISHQGRGIAQRYFEGHVE